MTTPAQTVHNRLIPGTVRWRLARRAARVTLDDRRKLKKWSGGSVKLLKGASASVSKTITEADILMYTAVSLDTNPVHLDRNKAAASVFGDRVAHGMLTAGLISACLGTKLPGPGTIYLSQTLNFSAPVKIGDTITATVVVLQVGANGRVTLATTCTNESQVPVLTGEAVVLTPKGDHE